MKISKFLLAGLLLVLGYFIGQHFHSPKTAEINVSSYDSEDSNLQNVVLSETNFVEKVTEKEKSPIEPPTDYNSESQVIELFEKAAPSVVFITSTGFTQSYWSLDVTEIPKGSGSGFMWDKKGHIVTNYHVIEGGEKFSVTLSDQSSYKATVVGIAPSQDLALLKIEAPANKLESIPVISSSELKVGQFAFAIGNPFGFDQTLTTGVISALGREITANNGRKIYDVIQTDASINPGNSGGPLLNSSGKLIGVNTAIYSPSGAYSGIGFSIPSNIVKRVIPDLIAYGEIKRPIVGVSLLPEGYNIGEGAMVSKVFPNSPAQKVGLQGIKRSRNGQLLAGDLIKEVNGINVKSNNEFIETIEKYQPDDIVTLSYLRDGKKKEVDIKLASSVAEFKD